MTDAMRERDYEALTRMWREQQIADWRRDPANDRIGERAYTIWLREDDK